MTVDTPGAGDLPTTCASGFMFANTHRTPLAKSKSSGHSCQDGLRTKTRSLQTGKASRTALGAASRRTAHQTYDDAALALHGSDRCSTSGRQVCASPGDEQVG